jgi:hypothetical protein
MAFAGNKRDGDGLVRRKEECQISYKRSVRYGHLTQEKECVCVANFILSHTILEEPQLINSSICFLVCLSVRTFSL